MENFLLTYFTSLVKKGLIKDVKLSSQEMVHNLGLEVYRRCDFNKNGIIERDELREWITNNEESFSIVADLLDGREDYF